VSLERLAAACVFPSFPGPEAPEWVLRWIESGLGGITLFAYNVENPGRLAALTGRLREAGELVLAIDEEGIFTATSSCSSTRAIRGAIAWCRSPKRSLPTAEPSSTHNFSSRCA
jgi:hypothetical protein